MHFEKFRTSTFFAFIISLISLSAKAQDLCGNVTGTFPTTNIYFSSGILTDSIDTQLGSVRLCDALEENLERLRDRELGFENEQFSFLPSINPSQGPITDIAQVLQQRAGQLGISDEVITPNLIYDAVIKQLSPEEVRTLIIASGVIDDREFLADSVTEDSLRVLSDLLVQAWGEALSDRRVVEQLHFETYRDALASGRRVIVVAHSQGNLFANKTVSAIKSQFPDYADSIEVLGVATPDSEMSSGFYLTARDDTIINLLRNLVGDIASINLIDNRPILGPEIREEFKHLFDESYFLPLLPSRLLIFEELARLSREMPYPEGRTPNMGEFRYLSFLTGDPGLPGDGIFIESEPSPTPGSSFFLITPDLLLTDVSETGIQLTVFGDQPPNDFNIRISIGVEGFRTSSCGVTSGGSVLSPRFNGSIGRTIFYSPAIIQTLISNARRLCPSVSQNRFKIQSIGIGSQGSLFPERVRIDAAAIGLGEGIFPTVAAPVPQ